MATLRAISLNREITLGQRNLIGRSPSAVVRHVDRRVSSEHASLSWSGLHWQLRDLGSVNGTLLNGKPVVSGSVVKVSSDDLIEFGCPDARWVLDDDGPPVATAVAERDGRLVTANRGWLLLPDADQPRASVILQAEGVWGFELDGQLVPVVDQQVVEVGGERYRLRLPGVALTEPTCPHEPRLQLADIDLEFRVSADEEHVDIWLSGMARAFKLPSRAHHYLLLTLARHRLKDRCSIAEAEAGWVHAESLADSLRMDVEKLNVDIYRARRQFLEAGVVDAQALVERRPDSRSLRLGVERIRIQRAAASWAALASPSRVG